MNNKGDNSPSLDYYELRRRHEQFKKRQAMNEPTAPKPQPKAARPATAKPRPPVENIEEPVVTDAPVQDTPIQDAPDEIIVPDTPIDALIDKEEVFDDEADLDEADDEDYGDDDDYDEDSENPNPFESFISLFHGVQQKLQNRRGRREEAIEDEEDADPLPPKKHKGLFGRKKDDEDYVDFDDSDYADDDYVAEEFPADEEPDADDIPGDRGERSHEPEFEEVPDAAPISHAEDIADIDDAFDDPAPSRISRRAAAAFDEDDGFDEDDATEDDESFEDEDTPQDSALKRFVSLFVVRDDEEYEDEYEEENFDSIGRFGRNDEEDDEQDLSDQFLHRINAVNPPEREEAAQSLYEDAADIEGGPDMDEKNKLRIDMTEQMAAGLETSGMSRRERRELAERQAAKEAAKRAAEMAAKAAFEEEKPLVADSVEDVSDGIVEIPSHPLDLDALSSAIDDTPASEPEAPSSSDMDLVDEPTREFKPLSKRDRKSSAKADAIFDFAAADNEEEDDEEEEDEDNKPGRFSLFHGKKNSRNEEDDEDEDIDEEDDDEDEEEPAEKSSRRGLFGKKSRSTKYDEDEDEDEEDDEDEDEYDEYDDYDEEDEYDEDDDYDDDDDEHSFGRSLLGFFKGLIGIVLFLLVIIFALNALDFFNVVSLDSLFEHHYNKAPAAFDTLFPGHEFKLRMNAGNDSLTAIDPLDDATYEPTASPAATDAPAATEAPVVTEAPAVTEAPVVTEAPTVTEAPATVG